VSIVISDAFQGRGLGTQLLRMLLQVGRDERLRRITASILPENREMQGVAQKSGFRLRHVPEEQVVKAEIDL
jgi:acetyltransferase